jgi:hypothetical protein
MVGTMSDQNESYVYLLEGVPHAATIDPARVVLFSVLTVFVTIACFAWWTGSAADEQFQPVLVVASWFVGLLIVGFLCFGLRAAPGARDVWLGRDFIAGSMSGQERALAIARHENIVAVTLDVAQGRIVGAVVRAKWLTMVPIRFVRDPALAVREIFEHGADRVTWRQSGRPLAKFSRDEVKALIEESHPPDISNALPPGTAYASADELFPQHKGLFAQTPTRSVNMVSLRSPTAVGRYVSLLLLQMFETGPTARILRRSEPLPAVTFGKDTAEPQPLEAVVRDLKTRCGIDPQTAGPLEGTLPLSIQQTPCTIRCRFDDRADACCEIVLEKAQTTAELD